MGLDNIPNKYACKTQGTAVMVELIDQATGKAILDENGQTYEQIDCDQTMACGGCPWKDRLGNSNGRVYGIFGTPCWYRGKYGVRLLDAVGIHGGQMLYGTSYDKPVVTPHACTLLADNIDDHLGDGDETERFFMDGEDVTDDLIYLRDWLMFVAEECDGSEAWY